MSDYNGWSNWETWNVNLWIDNEEPTYRAKRRFLRNNWRFDAQTVQAFCEECFPDGTPDMQNDENETVEQQWRKVNWEELAEAFAMEAKDYE